MAVDAVCGTWQEAVEDGFGAAGGARLWSQVDWRSLQSFSGLLRCGSDAPPAPRNPKPSPAQHHQQAASLGGGGFTPDSDPAV